MKEEALIEVFLGLIDREFSVVREAQIHAHLVMVQAQTRVRAELTLLKNLISSNESGRENSTALANSAQHLLSALDKPKTPTTPPPTTISSPTATHRKKRFSYGSKLVSENVLDEFESGVRERASTLPKPSQFATRSQPVIMSNTKNYGDSPKKGVRGVPLSYSGMKANMARLLPLLDTMQAHIRSAFHDLETDEMIQQPPRGRVATTTTRRNAHGKKIETRPVTGGQPKRLSSLGSSPPLEESVNEISQFDSSSPFTASETEGSSYLSEEPSFGPRSKSVHLFPRRKSASESVPSDQVSFEGRHSLTSDNLTDLESDEKSASSAKFPHQKRGNQKSKKKVEPRYDAFGPIDVVREKERICSLQFDSASSKIVTGNFGYQPVKVWDSLTGKCLLRLGGHKHSVLSFRFAKKLLATGCGDGFVRIWNLQNGGVTRLFDAHSPHGVLSLDIQGDLLATGATNSSVKVWDMAGGGDCLMSVHGKFQGVWCVKICGDEREVTVYAGCDDSSVMGWSYPSGHVLFRFEGHLGPVRSVVMKYGKIFSGGEDGLIRVWKKEQKVKECVMEIDAHKEGIRNLQILGDQLISSSLDGKIKFWDIDSGLCTQELVMDEQIFSFQYQDGVLLAGVVSAAKGQGLVRKWLVSPKNEDGYEL